VGLCRCAGASCISWGVSSMVISDSFNVVALTLESEFAACHVHGNLMKYL
jgi:hypothetical protein